MRCRAAFVALIAALLSVCLAGQSSPQQSQEPPVFRGGVELVRFDAFVTDKQGNAVAGLTADDFEIYENGQRQMVHMFAPVALPLQGSRRGSRVTSDVAINDQDQDQDRIYVIVFDWLSWAEAVRATKMVEQFLDRHFTDSDLAASSRSIEMLRCDSPTTVRD